MSNRLTDEMAALDEDLARAQAQQTLDYWSAKGGPNPRDEAISDLRALADGGAPGAWYMNRAADLLASGGA